MAVKNPVFPKEIFVTREEDTGDKTFLAVHDTVYNAADVDGEETKMAVYKLESVRLVKRVVEVK